MTAVATPKLICTECRHENESERIYCHNCGSRLDRSSVAPVKEPVKDTRKRVHKMFDPHRAKMRALFFKISKVLLGACGAAALILILSPPDVPPPSKSAMLGSQIRFDLEGMTSNRHQPAAMQYNEDQINSFLAYSLKSKQAALDKPLLDFKRMVVRFTEARCMVTAERSFFGYSLYSSCTFAPQLKDGKIEAPLKSGSIGRLPIHPQIGQYLTYLFSDIWGALDRDVKLVRKLGAVEFHDKEVVLLAAAPAAAAAAPAPAAAPPASPAPSTPQ